MNKLVLDELKASASLDLKGEEFNLLVHPRHLVKECLALFVGCNAIESCVDINLFYTTCSSQECCTVILPCCSV